MGYSGRYLHLYFFKRIYFPIIEKIINELEIDPKFVGTFFGHSLKHAQGQYVGC